MSQGLQIWDANGALTVDITTRLASLIGWVDTNGANGSLSVPDFGRGTPFAFANITVLGGISSVTPAVTASGTTLSWAYVGGTAGAPRLNARIFYGTY